MVNDRLAEGEWKDSTWHAPLLLFMFLPFSVQGGLGLGAKVDSGSGF